MRWVTPWQADFSNIKKNDNDLEVVNISSKPLIYLSNITENTTAILKLMKSQQKEMQRDIRIGAYTCDTF